MKTLKFWQVLVGVVYLVVYFSALYFFGATRLQAIAIVFAIAFFGSLFTMVDVPNAFVVFFATGLGTIAAAWWEFVTNGGPLGTFGSMLAFFVLLLFLAPAINKDWKFWLCPGIQGALTCAVLVYGPTLTAFMA